MSKHYTEQAHSDLWHALRTGEVTEYGIGPSGRIIAVTNIDDGYAGWFCRECGESLSLRNSKCPICQ